MAISISSFPQEVMLNIFQHLTLNAIGNASCVCQKWRELSDDKTLWNHEALKRYFPSFNILDEGTWKTNADLEALGLSVSDIKPLNVRQIIPDLKRFATLKVEGDLGFTLLTIPKNLSLKKLIAFGQNPKAGVTTLSVVDSNILTKLGDDTVDKTRRVLITNSIIQGSRDWEISNQVMFNKTGYTLFKILQVAALITLASVSCPPSSSTHYYEKQNTWETLCVEKIGTSTMKLEQLFQTAVGVNQQGLMSISVLYTGKCGAGVVQELPSERQTW